ncbi:MAG TPA: DUF1622 domain-containing protein [Micromonosporaceae bacterium]|nr:DUF1622 domain-containing protein [Micromonosporaceae bacterium]
MTRGIRLFEVVAVLVLVIGLIWSAVGAMALWRRTRDGQRAVKALRGGFGSVLLLALEILIAADLVKTVAVTPTLQSVGTLGLIVLIRTFLSFSLEIEIEGVPPWRRRSTGGASPGLGEGGTKKDGAS